jgi:DNA-binding beta-propeller fold protein YncE
MRKLALLATLLALPLATAAVIAVANATPRHIPGASGTIWAVERFDTGPNTLAAFDAGTGKVLGVVTVGKRPIGVTAPRGTAKVYSADERSNQLSVLSKESFTIVKQIPTGAASFPHHVMASANGNFVYFGRYNTNTVGVVDTSVDEMVHVWEASANPLAKTHAVWITTNGKDLYATNEGASSSAFGTLSKLDAETGHRVWEIQVGHRPSEVLVTPDGKTAYVTIRNDNAVKVYDVSGDAPEQLADVPIGGMPDTMQISNDGRTLVVGLRSVPQMALMDTETREVRHVAFNGYGISGHQWLSANGKYTFIALEALVSSQPGAIAVVDNDSAEVVDTYTYPGGPWPHGVFYEPQVLR